MVLVTVAVFLLVLVLASVEYFCRGGHARVHPSVHARADENIHLCPARGKTINAAVGEGQHVRPFLRIV